MTETVSQHAQYKNLETPSPIKMSGDKRHRHEDQENLSFIFNVFQLVPGGGSHHTHPVSRKKETQLIPDKLELRWNMNKP